MSGGSSSDDRQDSDHRPELRIRERALALLERDPRDAAPTDLRELDELVAEIQVHQVELGLQNEELRAAQRLTEELRARYYDLFERAPVGYVLMDGRGEISEANRAAATLLGLSGRTGSGRRLGFYVAHADRARFNRFLQDAIASDAPQRCEVTLQPEDLPQVRVLLDGVREPGPEVALARCRVTLIDVSARAAAEEALRVSEERFRLSFDRALIGKALAAPDGRLTQVNAALCQLFGTEPVELEAQRLAELAHPDLRAVCRAWLESLVAGEQAPSHQELRFLRRDGQVLWVDTCIAVERDPEGRPRHLIADFVDLTENRRLRASLADPDHLATLGLLAAGVAHEINNPLSYVLYNLESAVAELPRLAAEAPEELLERLEQASEGAGRVRKIARSLSAFARVEKRELSAVEVRAPLEAAVDMASAELKCRARVVRELGEVLRVLASEGKLAQVFLNLLVNSAQAIPEGDAERNEIRVRTWQEGAEVCVGGPGHRAGALRRGAGAPLQALLQHEAAGARHGPRPRHVAQHRAGPRRAHRRAERFRGRSGLRRPAPRRDGGGRARARGARGGEARRGEAGRGEARGSRAEGRQGAHADRGRRAPGPQRAPTDPGAPS